MDFINDADYAKNMDEKDPLSRYRPMFHIPIHGNGPVIYFTGNSLGLQPKKTAEYVNRELSDWATLGVDAHFKPDTGWYGYHELLRDSTARLVGALPEEVAVMNHLTVNLHLLLVTFYRPTASRYKIICEANAFPSDRYALQSQVRFHGYDPADAIIELSSEKGEVILREENIIKAINNNKEQLALVMIGGVNYYTGQVFDMQKIADAAHEWNIMAGFDLAHAAGNIKMKLHDWNVDFACWCTYKYLNSGPGGVGGIFIHKKHAENKSLPRFAGWWGNDPQTRFTMPHDFIPVPTADAWQLSNAPVLNMAALRASMELFDEAGMDALTARSYQLTSYLLYIIKQVDVEGRIKVLTPFEEQKTGCQLSLVVENGRAVFDFLSANGVVADWREPDVIRIAPVPLYNTFSDIYNFGQLLKSALAVMPAGKEKAAV